MVNPRQRRKARSSVSKASKKRDGPQHHRNKRVEVRGVPAFVEGWDKRKTARQNMTKLGLLGTLDPRQSGGLEAIEGVPFALRTDEQRSQPIAPTSAGEIPQGFARIERDEEGNVVRITLADGTSIDPSASVANVESDDEDAEKDDGKTPWGEALNGTDADPAVDQMNGDEVEVADAEDAPLDTRPRTQGLSFTAPSRRPVPAKTAVAQALEAAAAVRAQPNRHRATDGELDFLVSLVRKHGDDIERMARDIKLNRLQRTPGQLRAAFTRCGGIEEVRRIIEAPRLPSLEPSDA